MRTTVHFRLNNPTREKWDQYISLIPKIDLIMRVHNVELMSRRTQEHDYTVEETIEYEGSQTIYQLTIKLTEFLLLYDLTLDVLSSKDEPDPEGFKTTVTVRLRTGYRSRKYWERWLSKMSAVKQACMFNGVHLKSDLDMANYSVRFTAYYRRPSDIATAYFSTGWMYGRANIPLEITDIFEERHQLDLIEDMKEITNKLRRTI